MSDGCDTHGSDDTDGTLELRGGQVTLRTVTADHVPRLSSQRDSHAKLVHALSNVVRDHAIKTDGRQHERERAEGEKHGGAQMPGTRLLPNDFRE